MLVLGKYTVPRVGYHAVVKGLCCAVVIMIYHHQIHFVASMRMIYPSGSHDAVAISLVPHGTVPEIFSRNHLRIADKSVRGGR